MEPLLWWWRWWSGVDPNRDKLLNEAREAIEGLQEQVERLSSELQARETHIMALQQDLDEAEGELSRLRARVTEFERAGAEERPPDVEEPQPDVQETQPDVQEPQPDVKEPQPDVQETQPDVEEAQAVLGARVEVDDFTVIEGIGPKIASQLDDAGISTWRQLSESDPSELRRMLTEAGPRFRLHDPANWPAQAALLAHGRWQEFKDLTSKLREQRAS